MRAEDGGRRAEDGTGRNPRRRRWIYRGLMERPPGVRALGAGRGRAVRFLPAPASDPPPPPAAAASPTTGEGALEIALPAGLVVDSGVDSGAAGAGDGALTVACGGDSPARGVGALEVDREPAAACGGDSPARGEGAIDLDRLAAAAGKIGASPTMGYGASENEANLHETVIITELVENSHVTVNSGVDLGLDNTERTQFRESTVGLDDDGERAPHPGPLPVGGARGSCVAEADGERLVESSANLEGAPLPASGARESCVAEADAERLVDSTADFFRKEHLIPALSPRAGISDRRARARRPIPNPIRRGRTGPPVADQNRRG